MHIPKAPQPDNVNLNDMNIALFVCEAAPRRIAEITRRIAQHEKTLIALRDEHTQMKRLVAALNPITI